MFKVGYARPLAKTIVRVLRPPLYTIHNTVRVSTALLYGTVPLFEFDATILFIYLCVGSESAYSV